MSRIGPQKAMEKSEATGFRCSECRAIFSFVEEGEPLLVLGVSRAKEPGAHVSQCLALGIFCRTCEAAFIEAHDYVQIVGTGPGEDEERPGAAVPPRA